MNLRMIFLLLLENHWSVQISPNWVNTTKALKEKIKNMYGKTTKPKAVSVSVGFRPFGDLDYPGTDSQRLEIIERIWNQYYQCLLIKQKSVDSGRSLPPYTMATFAETAIELQCNVCVSPEDAIENIEWYFVEKSYAGTPVLIEEDEHKQISAFTFTLKIFNAQKFHQGMYYCKLRNDKDAPIFLHILSTNTEPFTEVKPTSSREGPHVLKPSRIPRTNIVLWHDWTEWTECGYCGKVGRRSKIGYCKVGLYESLPDSVKSSVGDALVSQSELPTRVALSEVDALLKIFSNGIPCRSRLLPDKFTRSEYVKHHPTQISCPSDIIVEVLDAEGNIVNRYNNTAGEYYHSQDLPLLPTGPQRVTYYADLGKPFIIPCPNKYHENTPIEWSVGGKIWLKKNVEDISNGRITLNGVNQIVFRRIEELDQKIYTCWQNREIVGVVRIILNRTPTYFEEYLATIKLYPTLMIVALVCTFLWVIVKMFLNRDKARMGATVAVSTRANYSRNIKLAYDLPDFSRS